MHNKKRKVSIHDVARLAGVSITTVSRVINKVPTVSPSNYAKVERAIAELSYEPDANAQRLARGQSNAVGFVMPGYPGIFYSFYAIELIRGAGHACEELHLDLMFHITNGFNDLNTGSVGGVVFADIIENRRQIDAVVKAGIPCVVINNIVEDSAVNWIGVDNARGGGMAAEHLAGLGHRRIATITGSGRTQSGKHRFDGFRDYLSRSGIPLPDHYIYESDYSRRSARDGMERFLALPQPPTAVFIASDDMALEAMSVIMEKGLSVPGDISLIGFDDNPSALYGPVSLTTIRQPLFRMAEEAVRFLGRSIKGDSGESVRKLLAPELVIRDSCAQV